jgi:hypothetical protein
METKTLEMKCIDKLGQYYVNSSEKEAVEEVNKARSKKQSPERIEFLIQKYYRLVNRNLKEYGCSDGDLFDTIHPIFQEYLATIKKQTGNNQK